jgi:hypothetical protein
MLLRFRWPSGTLFVVAFMLLPFGPLLAQTAQPQLWLDPASALPGTVVTATGSGFPAASDGQLLWADGSPLGAFATDPAGAFSLEIAVPDVAPDTYGVIAVVESADGPVSYEAALTVAMPPEPTATTAPPVETVMPTEIPAPAAAPTEALPEPTAPAPEPIEVPFYPIVASSQSDNSPAAAVVHDGDPVTYWITDTIVPDAASVTLDLGEVRPIGATRFLLATSGTLPSVEILLSEDGVTWGSLVTLDGTTLAAGVWLEHPVDVWARYMQFVVPNPNGMPQIGGFAEIELWPAADARPLAAILTPEAPIEQTDDALSEQGLLVAEVTGRGVITGTGGDGANCRVAPDLNADVIAVLPDATTIDLAGPPAGEWQPVICNDEAGYVSAQYVQVAEDAEPTAPLAATPTEAVPPTEAGIATSDAAANVELSASTPADANAPTTIVFGSVADAHVDRGRPNTNYKGERTLVADREPNREAYLGFEVTGITDPVQQATLRLWVSGGTSNAPPIALVSDAIWSESAITWNTRPTVGGGVDDKESVKDNTWIEYDVTSLITGDGTYTFALIPQSRNGMYINSREASSNQPELVVVTGGTAATPIGEPTVPATPPGEEPTEPATPVATEPASPAPTVPGTPMPTPPPNSGKSAVLLAAGDIADCNENGDELTANILDAQAGTIATLGDNVYNSGTARQFAECYDPSWGRHKDRTMPAPGNHDYNTSGATGYYGYFGAAAGDPSQGYYSYDLGAWHIIVLNSNIDMAPGSAQEQWLRSDLAAHPVSCTLAYWHHPRFNSGASHGNRRETAPLYQALYENGAEIVLSGHEHLYERFAPQNPNAQADPAFGIRQFIVGTGGKNLYRFDSPEPNSEIRNNATFGVLRLTLNPDGYSWQFLPVEGSSFTDSGSGTCHGAPSAVATTGTAIPAGPAFVLSGTTRGIAIGGRRSR